ncbi:hypothetical protein like AT1G64500 [Hibiscus trionum]|uniref:Glutaredoxin domain-containing protein n=1 Tax=Hibiscus trionum TaxID=183268 RepID=A0A9W7JJP7_HIBTR|nr:hypothetical protein like AT1G64500 [Hibiscus trionum]
MGCSASKSSTATVDYYRPPPSSFAVFDINAIDEPWVKAEQRQQENQEKPTHVPAVILEKLNALEAAKLSSKESKPAANEFRKTESMKKEIKTTPTELKNPEPRVSAQPVASSKLKDNIFIVKDREEREKEGRMANYDKIMTKRGPLSEFPEICPPGGNDTVVIYTTSLRRAEGILSMGRVERGVGRLACGGCDGTRFVPCVECGGSCRVAAVSGGDKWERCEKCNENGLIHCLTCL